MTDYYKDWPPEPYIPREKYKPDVLADEVFELRNAKEISLYEAKSILTKQQLLKDLAKGRQGLSTSVLYDILEYIIEND